MPFSLSKSSLANLYGVHPKLVSVVLEAIRISAVDFKVIEGVRTYKRQQQLYAQGRTAPGKIVTWTMNSKHFVDPVSSYGLAVDLLPAPYDWKDIEPFNQMAEAMLAAAKKQGVKIRWGADWDMDGTFREKGETDSPHFEIVL